MLDNLDSRALRRTDCYGQRFMKAGTYRYTILPPNGHLLSDDRPFTVEVSDRPKEEMEQHDVIVRFADGKFEPDRETVTIDAGDLVLWNCPGGATIPYVVAGEKEFFASDRLRNECGFSHAFGFAGEYHWTDAYGSGASGVVRVTNPDCKEADDFQRWRKALSKGTIVTLTDGKADPREVDVMVGQTVFFAVATGPGVSITDERLLGQTHDKDEPPKGRDKDKKKKRKK
jgi:plastocyanin